MIQGQWAFDANRARIARSMGKCCAADIVDVEKTGTNEHESLVREVPRETRLRAKMRMERICRFGWKIKSRNYFIYLRFVRFYCFIHIHMYSSAEHDAW